MTGVVYIVRRVGSDLVKIGFSRSVKRRVHDLQCSVAEPLEVLRTVPGSFETEAWFHRTFAACAERGEWYRLHPDMLTVEPPRTMTRVLPFGARAPKPPPDGFCALLRSIGTSKQLARLMNCPPRTVERWVSGQTAMPGDAFVRLLGASPQFAIGVMRLAGHHEEADKMEVMYHLNAALDRYQALPKTASQVAA